MDIKQLFEWQRELDGISKGRKGIYSEKVVEKKILALMVILGEIANETCCCKQGVRHKVTSKGKVLDKYIEGLQYIISLGIDFGVDIETHDENFLIVSCESLTVQFLHIYEALIIVKVKKSHEMYKAALYTYFQLGKLLAFSTKEIEKAYVHKKESIIKSRLVVVK